MNCTTAKFDCQRVVLADNKAGAFPAPGGRGFTIVLEGGNAMSIDIDMSTLGWNPASEPPSTDRTVKVMWQDHETAGVATGFYSEGRWFIVGSYTDVLLWKELPAEDICSNPWCNEVVVSNGLCWPCLQKREEFSQASFDATLSRLRDLEQELKEGE